MLLHKLDAILQPMLKMQTEAAIKLELDQFDLMDIDFTVDNVIITIPRIYFEELD